MPIDIAVVPVAGRGTRLLPLTKSQPKEMLPVGRKPVVQYVAEELADAGVHKLVFITGPGKTAIENHFDVDDELTNHLRLTGKEDLLAEVTERTDQEHFYTRQRRQLGLGHAVLCARSIVGTQPFVVALGDSLIGLHGRSNIVARMIREFTERKADAVIAFEEVEPDEVVHYGIAQPRGAVAPVFELADIVEKPAVADAPSRMAVAGRYVLSPAIFELLADTKPGKGGEIQLTDALRALVRGGGKIVGVRLAPGEHRHDVGNYERYFRAFIESALTDPQYGPAMREFVAELLAKLGGK
ncbi:MAG: NTP transferase domain-containing protein [Pirellulales bacterium]|nr:NTP transferase domain-containing protein [Pirellulales bacterium]